MRFDSDPTGATIVLAVGPKLRVFNGPSPAARWHHVLDSDIVAVRTTAATVVAATAAGQVWWFDAHGQHVLGAAELAASPLALAVDQDGTTAVALPGKIVIRTPTVPRATADIGGADLLAWGTGSTLGMGRGPHLYTFDANGTELQRHALNHVITALAWCPYGSWVVALGSRVVAINLQGVVSRVAEVESGRPVVEMACSPRGDRLAMRLDTHRISVVTLPEGADAGAVEASHDQLCGVALGPGRWLGTADTAGRAHVADLRAGTTESPALTVQPEPADLDPPPSTPDPLPLTPATAPSRTLPKAVSEPGDPPAPLPKKRTAAWPFYAIGFIGLTWGALLLCAGVLTTLLQART